MFYHKNLKLMASQKLKPIRMYGGRQVFHVVVGQAASMNVGRCIQSSGIVIIMELASFGCSLSQEEKRQEF
jgi:hypothetical protein